MHKKGLETLNELDLDQVRSQGSVFQLPDTDIIYLGWGTPTDGALSHMAEFSLLSFFANEEIKYLPGQLIKTSKNELLTYLESVLAKTEKLKTILGINEEEIYAQDFEALKLAFSKSDLKKCVLKSRQFYQVDCPDPLLIIYHLLQAPKGLLYGHWNQEFTMLGMTPEVLFEKEKSHYKTMALAGTKKNEQKEELLSDPKEREEHQLVIDDIVSKLGDTQCKVSETKLLDYNQFSHLYTEISFTSPKESHDILKCLTPTAALGGYPSDLAKAFLQSTSYHQKYGETFFGGAFQFKLDQWSCALVNIRNIQWNQEQLWIESGTGIVNDSVLAKEISEIKLKRKSIEELIFE